MLRLTSVNSKPTSLRRTMARSPAAMQARRPALPNPVAGQARPGMQRTDKIRSSGYSRSQLKRWGAASPVKIPPIAPPAEIHM
jgi:hypothetical protein